MDNSAKILLLGQTGAGKSAFINYFLGKDEAETGVGKPITQEIHEYVIENGRYPMKIYDTKGIEALNASNQIDDIISFIAKKNNSENIFDWFHTIFYCVSMSQNRFQDFEAKFINDLREKLGQHIHIIITHCDSATEDTICRMRERITALLSNINGIDIFEVVSVNITKRNGQKVVQKGKEEISQRVFSLLLDDIANKVSNDYAKAIYAALLHVAYSAYIEFNDMIDDNVNIKGLIALIKDEQALEDRLQEELDELEERFERVTNETNEKFNRILQPLLQLFSSYWGIVTNTFIDDALLNFENAFYELDDEWFTAIEEEGMAILFPTLGKKGKIDSSGDFIEPDDDEYFEWAKLIAYGVKDLFRMKKNLRNALDKMYASFVSTIPPESEWRKKAYDRITEMVKDLQQKAMSKDKDKDAYFQTMNDLVQRMKELKGVLSQIAGK